MVSRNWKLYGDPASPYVTRVILFARLKGIDLPACEVPGGNPRSAKFHQINPLGKVPSLDTGERIIPESETICEYLEEMLPEPSGLPDDADGRMVSRLTARITDLYISPHFSPLMAHLDPAQRDHAVVAETAAAWHKAFQSLAHYMGPGPFCAGAHPTLGDCALGPYMRLLKNTVFPVFDEIDDPTRHDRLAKWWAALQADRMLRAGLDEYGAIVDAFFAANRATLTQHS